MSKQEIIKKLRENTVKIKSFEVKMIGISSFIAREKATDKSDIDFVVAFEKRKATFKNFCEFVDFLEKLFGRDVDILTPDDIGSI